jgi:hypothetical protein
LSHAAVGIEFGRTRSNRMDVGTAVGRLALSRPVALVLRPRLGSAAVR